MTAIEMLGAGIQLFVAGIMIGQSVERILRARERRAANADRDR